MSYLGHLQKVQFDTPITAAYGTQWPRYTYRFVYYVPGALLTDTWVQSTTNYLVYQVLTLYLVRFTRKSLARFHIWYLPCVEVELHVRQNQE